MPSENRRAERRADALSRERIVDAAIAILDAEGTAGLTFRALAARLATGSGAIYWHVADKDALLAAAADRIVAKTLTYAGEASSPRETLRTVAMAMFDAIDAHPWIGAQLSGDPWQHAVLRILEAVGAQVEALGASEQVRFNAATALLSFILGLAGQYAVRSRRFAAGTDRNTALRAVADQWLELDPAEHPFVHQVAAQLPDHDDREQFLAGIDLIVAGIVSRRHREEEGCEE